MSLAKLESAHMEYKLLFFLIFVREIKGFFRFVSMLQSASTGQFLLAKPCNLYDTIQPKIGKTKIKPVNLISREAKKWAIKVQRFDDSIDPSNPKITRWGTRIQNRSSRRKRWKNKATSNNKRGKDSDGCRSRLPPRERGKGSSHRRETRGCSASCGWPAMTRGQASPDYCSHPFSLCRPRERREKTLLLLLLCMWTRKWGPCWLRKYFVFGHKLGTVGRFGFISYVILEVRNGNTR